MEEEIEVSVGGAVGFSAVTPQPTDVVVTQDDDVPKEDERPHYRHSFMERAAMRMARYPRSHFWLSFLLALALSIIGFLLGDFSVAADNTGWNSRGTLIANRQTQLMLVLYNDYQLFSGQEEAWFHLETTVQLGWENGDDDDDGYDDDEAAYYDRARRLQEPSRYSLSQNRQHVVFNLLLNRHLIQEQKIIRNQTQTQSADQVFALQEEQANLTQAPTQELEFHYPISLLKCNVAWYTDGQMTSGSRLWPVWKVKDGNHGQSALDPHILLDLCTSEAETQQVLVENMLCGGCPDQQCLPPYSLVLFIRLLIPGGMQMNCNTLIESYTERNLQSTSEAAFEDCVKAIEYASDADTLPEECPEVFLPTLVDEFFLGTGLIQYTTSIFATHTDDDNVQAMYEHVHEYNKGTATIEGAYDTQWEDFATLHADVAVQSDLVLASASAIVTAFAMLLHTRSFFLTGVGILQILLTFPLSYFTYRFLGNLTFFPLLNFIAVFVGFALGADHVFVAVDKWKNTRKDFPNHTTPQIAAKALPDSAHAMLLTTSTTAIAFFGTAICPVAPIRLFAFFCGLLVVWDYLLDVLLIFPCLCIKDEWNQARSNRSSCQGIHSKGQPDEQEIGIETATQVADHNDNPQAFCNRLFKNVDEDSNPSLIRRLLLGYYSLLHATRWPLLLACAAAFAACAYFATTLQLPTTSDVRLLQRDQEFEKAYSWRRHLLSSVMAKESGSWTFAVWGLQPADTGDHNDPTSWSTLVLDESFDPSTPHAQVYLRDFCGDLFAQDFASKVYADYDCPLNVFDQWLQRQANETSSSNDSIYTLHCGGAEGLPIEDSKTFHACLTAWAQQEEEYSILSREGKVKVVYLTFSSRVRYDSPNGDLDFEWHLTENWFDDYQSTAPAEARQAFFSSHDYWWYDTNSEMFKTAFGSAAIAILASAAIILISSRSLTMTLFSVVSVAYVLVSVTAMMVAANWHLGFLESICFAILIGISVDFCLHLSHAYSSLPGHVSKERRTKHALLYMGPSILAAAATTWAGALVMLFCVVTFFTKFATVLFFTIIQSLVGSFVVFLTMADALGPAHPTYLADKLCARDLPEKANQSKGESCDSQ